MIIYLCRIEIDEVMIYLCPNIKYTRMFLNIYNKRIKKFIREHNYSLHHQNSMTFMISDPRVSL